MKGLRNFGEREGMIGGVAGPLPIDGGEAV